MTVILQVAVAATVKDWSWGWFLAVVYVVGATANHNLFLAIHEMSHNLGSKVLWVNNAIGMLANMPIVIPYCVTFRPYHMVHGPRFLFSPYPSQSTTYLRDYIFDLHFLNPSDIAC